MVLGKLRTGTLATDHYLHYSNGMYNKLFTKILDSTIWLESDSTRLVWITFLAVMDEDGFVALSSIGNVSARARVSLEDTERAIKDLESPDKLDPSQDHDGRRIERVPYGWMVLNSTKYREIVIRENAKAKNRDRVAKYRAKRGNAKVMVSNEKVMPSVAVTETNTNTSSVSQKPSTPGRQKFEEELKKTLKANP